MSLDWDWETRSVIDITRRGAYVYAQHPSTFALLASFKLVAEPDENPAVSAWVAAGGPLKTLLRWKHGEPCPPYVRAYVDAGGEIRAHNAAFERLIWWFCMVPLGWPRPALEQFRCLAVTAAAMSLPRSLDRLGAALGLAVQKDKRGRELMKIHSIPVGFDPSGSPIWHKLADDPVSLEAYHAYCDTDVLTEEGAARRLIPLSPAEMDVYWLNERINDRGLRIDIASAKAALAIADAAKERINRELTLVTGGRVTALTQAAKLKEWVISQGVDIPSIDKDDVEEFLHDYDGMPDAVRRALELRQEGAKPSVEKIAAMLERVSDDGRARGVYLHHGAGQTGRFSSRGVQAHNMPKYRKAFEKELEEGRLDLDLLFDFIRSGRPDTLEFMYGPDLGRPLHLLSDAVRSFIIPDPGYEFIDADYSSIESRMAAWFAAEQWKLEAYQTLDRGEGYGIYELVAAGIYGLPIELITREHRPTGKLGELACTYQTGAGGIRKFARQSRIKLFKLFDALWAAADEDRRAYADKRFVDRMKAHDPNAHALGREGWIAAELIKVGWRSKNPGVVACWGALEEAATTAASHPGAVVTTLAGRVRYVASHGFLWCQLPSGRCLAYGAPKIEETEAPWADKTLPVEEREKKLSLTVKGVDTVSEKWMRFPVYGGSLFNNCLSEHTEVLTSNGWKKIIDVLTDDLLWDGLKWVRHEGVVFQGARPVLDFGGVYLTPEHKVWTNDGWKRADQTDIHAAASASPDPETDRRALRLARRHRLRWQRREEVLVEGPLRLRHGEVVHRGRAYEGQDDPLRMPNHRALSATEEARHVLPRRLYRASQHGQPVPRREGSRVSALRRAWNYGLRALAALRGFLVGHGTDLGARTDLGSTGQQRGLLAGELRLAGSQSTGEEHPLQPRDRYTVRPDAAVRSRRPDRARDHDAPVSSECRLADPASLRPSRPEPKGAVAVYDILNAGPRHRFTVRGGPGRPAFIVSNCVQGSARDILVNGMQKVERAGYPIVMHTHDEIVSEVPRGHGNVREYERLMCELPGWAAGLPLTADGWRGTRYRK